MWSWLSCWEKADWDHAHHIKSHYKQPSHHEQDMTQPLACYFISSGHNSYLQGNQLTSTAGTQTIAVGLRHGCRVVELDVYDGPTEPVVTHGGTLTSTVTFQDCVRAVAKHAFLSSPYPVILTIENHVKDQQKQMVGILKATLGNHLFIPKPEQLTAGGQWLSPKELKHKVVLRMKVKPDSTLPELAELVYICNSSLKAYDITGGRAVPSSHSLPDSKLPQVPEYAKYVAASKLFSFRTPQAAQAAQAAKAGEDPEKIAAAYTAAMRKATGDGSAAVSCADAAGRTKGSKDLDQAKPTTAAAAAGGAVERVGHAAAYAAAAAAGGGGVAGVHASNVTVGAEGSQQTQKLQSFRLSMEDVTQEEALEEDLDDTLRFASTSSAGSAPAGLSKPPLAAVLAYTQKHMLRCYPSAWRMLDNSNPNPAAAWSFGISLAALNWQLWDQALWVNEAFFSQNNGSGYVLKPSWMRTVNMDEPVPARDPKALAVHVYSAFRPQGHRVGVFKDDMYVELRVVGMPHDTTMQSSPHKNNSGRLVVDQDFEFSVRYPELAVLVILLKDQDNVMSDTVLGYAALPLANLVAGAYHIPLAKPKVMGGDTSHTGMWVKLKLGWQGAS